MVFLKNIKMDNCKSEADTPLIIGFIVERLKTYCANIRSEGFPD